MSFDKDTKNEADALQQRLKADLVGVRMHLHELSHRDDPGSNELNQVYTTEFLDCLGLGTFTLEAVNSLAEVLGYSPSQLLDTLLSAGVHTVLKEAQRTADDCPKTVKDSAIESDWENVLSNFPALRTDSCITGKDASRVSAKHIQSAYEC